MPSPVQTDPARAVAARPPDPPPVSAPGTPEPRPPSLGQRVRRRIFGPPRRLDDARLFHKVSLVAVLAWVGLGADGLSSSAYGPEEAFRSLGAHTYLAVPLAAVMAATVLLISAGYSRVIDLFPHGGGGYVVASKLLGPRVGLVSGCALLVDYVLTIAISVAAAGDAIFSFVPAHLHDWKLPAECACVAGLTALNIRGVRESVLALTPVFFVFVATHLVVIVAGVLGHLPRLPATAASVASGFEHGVTTLGLGGLALLLVRAFSLGGGTYTGIEAVSNGVVVMRHPQARTAKRTMLYMGASLAFTATGLLLCYLLWDVSPVRGMTMNAVLVEGLAHSLTGGSAVGRAFALVTVLSEGALLVVAAQAGFADGPRVLSSMALDGWVPRRFAALSDRLTTQNGIVLMGVCALGALLYTGGDVRHIVVMYSINVFLTFSLSMLGMAAHTASARRRGEGDGARPRKRRLALFAGAFALCATVLAFTVYEKFGEGGWVTLVVTGAVIGACALIRRHYDAVSRLLTRTFENLESPPLSPPAADLAGGAPPRPAEPDPAHPVAVILVSAYSGFGVHTTLNALRAFPGHFRGLVFASVGVIDSGAFKGEDSLGELRARTESTVARYADAARRMGLPAAGRCAVGTDAVDEAERLCLAIARDFPRSTFFAGQVIFRRETWPRHLLHNQTAYAIQRRLQWAGHTVVILPARAF